MKVANKRVIAKRKKMMFREWMTLLHHGGFEKLFQFEELSKPLFFGNKVVPDDLNELSFGQIVKLQGIKEVGEMFFVPPQVILGVSVDVVMVTDAVDVVRFSSWVAREMKRINNLFASTNRKPTEHEKKAGIDLLNFGIFGTVDYYAQRMGITDHEEVMDVPWIRVYKCLQIDSEKAKYEQRLKKVYEEERRK